MTACPVHPCQLTYPTRTRAKAIRRGMRWGRRLTVIRCDGHAHIVTDLTNRNEES